MKRIFTIILLISSLPAFSQEKRKFITGNDILTYSLAFVSGAAQGTEEAIKFHYNEGFKRVFPNANDQFWDPRVSWQNKNNSKFPLARTVFSFTTDGYHLMRFASRSTMMAAVVFSVNDFKGLTRKEKVFMVAKKFTLSMLSNRLGQWIVYDNILREKY